MYALKPLNSNHEVNAFVEKRKVAFSTGDKSDFAWSSIPGAAESVVVTQPDAMMVGVTVTVASSPFH